MGNGYARRPSTQQNNQLYQEYRIETIRKISVQIKTKVCRPKPRVKKGATFRGSKGRSIIN